MRVDSKRHLPLPIYRAIWEYITLAQYARPGAPAAEIVRGGLKSARRLIRPRADQASVDQGLLSAAPPYLLNRAAPVPDLEQMVTALEDALHNWFFTRDPKASVKVVVGPPGSNVDKTVAALGRRKGWPVYGPPTPGEILAGGNSWLDNLDANGLLPVVIPRLGNCYLRHHNGLALIGRFLDWLESTRRRCLVACDSWAWAYLVKALQIDAMLPPPLTLAPIDGKRLQFWLPTLARSNGGRFLFREAGSGQPVFMVATGCDELIRRNTLRGQMEAFGEWAGASTFAKQLAAYSRGLPEVAWSWWRECLQVTPEADKAISRGLDSEENWYTVWVKPWSQLPLPSVPNSTGTTESIVLHTLLLHSGTTSELLEILLPFSHNQIRRALHQLSADHLAKVTADGCWRVTLLAYPAVRQYMENEGYLVDAF